MLRPDSSVDRATYLTGVIMLLLSVLTTGVLITTLDGTLGKSIVTFALLLLSCAASYTVAQL